MNPQVQEAPVVEQTTPLPSTLDNHAALLEEALSRPLAQDHAEFELALRMGEAAADSKSGFAENTPQAAMKILLGKELGISPIVAMSSINVIKGRTSCSGALIASLLRRAGFHWTFPRHDKDGCTIAVFRHGKPLMEQWIDDAGAWRERQVMVSWARENAERAKLTGSHKSGEETNYEKYGEDMYYNRCITRLQKRYAPEVSHGIPLYTPDELEGIEAIPVGHGDGLKMPERKAAEPQQPSSGTQAPASNGQKVSK
jgi:hypothetical protein